MDNSAATRREPRARASADTPLDLVSTVQALVRALRARILDGEYEAPAPLREVELAEEYGVGRYTVRAALQALVHEGLAEHRPNRGVYVPRLTEADVVDLYVTRAAIECEAARLIVRRSADLDAVREALDALGSLGSDAPWASVIERDLAVHESLVRATGSRRMATIFASLRNQVLLCLSQMRHLHPLPPIVSDHAELVAGLEGDDPDAAAERVRAHLEIALREVLRSSQAAAAL